MDQNAKKQAVAKAAIEYVEADSIVGVGTGSTVNFFIEELGNIKHKIDLLYRVRLVGARLLKARQRFQGATLFQFAPTEYSLRR